jgi:ELWxxDGT repeat protein
MNRWKWLLAGLLGILSGNPPVQGQTPDRVQDPNSLRASRAMNPVGMTAVGSVVFFVANDAAHGWELWRSDGTAPGTRLVKDIVQGPGWPSWSFMMSAEGLLFFEPWDRSELWRSDGTAPGTFYLAHFSNISGRAELGGMLFFTADRQLWKSDGTVAGTVMVKDMGGPGGPYELIRVGDRLFFGEYVLGGGSLWTSDGTEAGTVRLKTISPYHLTDVDGTLFFSGYEPTGGTALWKSDGTEAGTVMVRDVQPNAGFSLGAAMGGILFFQGSTPDTGWELWRSDGTEAGTYMVRDVNPGPASFFVEAWAVMNGSLFFSASDNVRGFELWRSDGTEAGTVRLTDVLGVPTGSQPECLTTVGANLYYSASDGVHGYELWRSDGTAEGTGPIDINPGSASAYPQYLAAMGETVFFAADDGHGQRLWRSGPAGTGRVDQWGCRGFPRLCQLQEELPSSPPPSMRVPTKVCSAWD